MKKKDIKRKKSSLYFAITMMVILILLLVAIGFMTGKSIQREQDRMAMYKYCTAFNFMNYLNTENTRHWQNDTFEVSVVPNCLALIDPYEKVSMSYEEWLLRNNLTHIQWNYTRPDSYTFNSSHGIQKV